MSDDLLSLEEIFHIRQLGYGDIPNYYKVFKWFREKWGYTSWIEQSEKKYIYKIYKTDVYYRPKDCNEYPHCKNYEEAESKLLKELITIVKEKESWLK